MPVSDFPPRPQGSAYESQEFASWLDKLRNALNINTHNQVTQAVYNDEVDIFSVADNKRMKVEIDNLGVFLENRTSDPASPRVGQMWLRTDL